MRKTLLGTLMQLSVIAFLFTACSKEENMVNPQPQPLPLPTVPTPVNGFVPVLVKAAITVGDVLYDSIPAHFTIASWDVNNVAVQKDTTLNPGAQLIYLPKAAVRYSLKMQKWGVTYEKTLNRAEVTEGALYLLGGHKDAKKLQWVTEETFINGAPALSAKQHFIYDAQGRINEVHAYAPDPNGGALVSGSMDLFMFDRNELWVNSVRKSDGVVFSHSAYTFDLQGRIVRIRHRYLTENHLYTNLHTSEGVVMLFGDNATNLNGSRVALRFIGGNRVEEKTIITHYPTTVKTFRYDFNINPYAIIKMPHMYFEHSSKNNVVAESWEGNDQWIYEYSYDTEGYVIGVTTKARNNNGAFINYSRTMYTY